MIGIVYVVVAIICGMVSAAIAGKKERNVIGWFFIGLLLSIIAVILILVLPKKLGTK